MIGRLFAAALALTMVGGLASAAFAQDEGPRPSSDHTWSEPSYPGGYTVEPVAPQVTAPAVAPHYVWEEGYENGGKWHGHWELVP